MKNSVVIEAHFLPSLEYMCGVMTFDEIILEGCEHYAKQTYRNRCYINTAHGVKIITVPIKERRRKILMRDVKIGDGRQWRNSHWRTIESAYRKAPFFEYYFEGLKSILLGSHEYLFDLNRDLLSFCLRSTGIEEKISASVTYEGKVEENKTDLRSVIMDKKPFGTRNIYKPYTYYQVFGNEFASNLSIIDLLFCEGPRSLAILKGSQVT